LDFNFSNYRGGVEEEEEEAFIEFLKYTSQLWAKKKLIRLSKYI
jgi:hypothetical protein